MSWYDEIPHLCRRSMSEIGFAFYVREKMKNKLIATDDDLRLTLGPDWNKIIGHLVADGIMKKHPCGRRWILSVVAPGDRKRERCRQIGRKNRTFARFEEVVISIKENTSNEKNNENP